MSENNGRSMKSILKASTAAGLAAVMLAAAAPLTAVPALAEAVEVDAPQVPSFGDVVEAVLPAVVSVRVQSNVRDTSSDESNFSFNFGGRGFEDLPDDHPLKRFFREFGGPGMEGPRSDRNPRAERGPGRLRPTAQGSGFFISEDGYIVTNNHVIDGGQAFTVVLNDGKEYDAKLVGSDSRTDLALLKVDQKDVKFTYVKFADDSKARIGDWVVAVGNPFGLGGTVTAGIISARGRNIGSGPYDDYLQIDAAVNRGNSGGPDFNLNGEVVGINTAIFSPSGGNVGIAFAIPASVATDVIAKLKETGSVSRGWLGVQIQPVTDDIAESIGLSEAKGALVVAPQEGSPGAAAGIKEGDVVTAVNGDPVEDPRDLARRIAAFAPQTTVDVALWRDGKSVEVKVKLGELPADTTAAADGETEAVPAPGADEELANLGLSVRPADGGKGVAIVDIDPDSDAADKGLKAGETITSVNNQQVSSVDDIKRVIDQAKKDGRTRALFQVESESGSRFVALPINQG